MLKIWLWIIFAVVLMAYVIGTIIAFVIFKKRKSWQNDKKAIIQTVIKYALLVLLYDLTYMSIFNKWLIFTFVFGTASVAMVLFDLAMTSIFGKKSRKLILGITSVAAVGLSIYLISVIPNDTVQEIVTEMVAALYGGLLTLVSVLWTIQHTNQERKNDELKAIRPVIYPFSEYNDFDIRQFVPLEFTENDSTERSKSNRIDLGMVKNTDNGILILERIELEGREFRVSYSNALDKNNFAQIILYTADRAKIEGENNDSNKILEYILVGKDVLDHLVKFKIKFDKKERKIIEINPEDVKQK